MGHRSAGYAQGYIRKTLEKPTYYVSPGRQHSCHGLSAFDRRACRSIGRLRTRRELLLRSQPPTRWPMKQLLKRPFLANVFDKRGRSVKSGHSGMAVFGNVATMQLDRGGKILLGRNY